VQLRSFYDTPGFLLLAAGDDEKPAGCVGMRVHAEGIGEVRRLFVNPDSRASGIGRALIAELIDRSRAQGLDRLVLNTLPTMVQAVGLYRSLGFVPCAPYVDDPTDGVLFFELLLTSASG
jgi:ribosomal protein S18 acetylase RimI-like enzyme